MKIQIAKDYGFRKIVRVLMNPDDPQWVEPDGTPSPANETGDTEDPDKTKIVSFTTRLNWDIREFQFEGEELTKLSDSDDSESERVEKTDSEIIAQALEMAARLSIPARDMVGT